MDTCELHLPNTWTPPVCFLQFILSPPSTASLRLLKTFVTNSCVSLILHLILFVFKSHIFFLGRTLSSENCSFHSIFYLQNLFKLFHGTRFNIFCTKCYSTMQSTSLHLFIFPLMDIPAGQFFCNEQWYHGILMLVS